MAKKNKEIAEQVLDQYSTYKTQSTGRLQRYDDNLRWFKGKKEIMYKDGRESWQPAILANIIESNVRTVTAVLTDSKPIMRVKSFPLVSADQLQPDMETAIQNFNENNDNVLNHIWRINDFHKKLKRIVLDGALTGIMVSRTYWDQYAYGGLGEVGCESVHPRYIFFDEKVQDINIEDGSCDWFMYVVDKPLSWFHYYWPGKIIKPTENTKKEPSDMQMGQFIEAYKADWEIEETRAIDGGKMETKRKMKYPRGRKILVGGDIVLNPDYEDQKLYRFPFAVEPIANQSETAWGEDDVTRQITLQQDLNWKMNQLSTIISLSANHQAIGDDECGVNIESLMEKFADKPGQFFALESGKDLDDFHNHFEILKSPAFEPQLFQYVYTVLEFMEKVTGVTKLIQGMAAKKERETAFEVGKMLETATIRLRDRAGHIEEFIRQTGLNWMCLVSQNYKEPRPIWRIDNDTEEMVASTYEFPTTKDKITGKSEPIEWEYDIVVQPDSTLPIDLNSKADLAMRLKERQVISNAEVAKQLQIQNWEVLPDQAPGQAGQPPPTGAM